MRLTQPQGRRSQVRGRRGSGRGRRGGRSHAWKSPQDGWLLVLEWVKSDPGMVQRMAPGNLAANHGGNKIAAQLSAGSGQRDNDFAIRSPRPGAESISTAERVGR